MDSGSMGKARKKGRWDPFTMRDECGDCGSFFPWTELYPFRRVFKGDFSVFFLLTFRDSVYYPKRHPANPETVRKDAYERPTSFLRGHYAKKARAKMAEKTQKPRQYFLVGAMWNGTVDMYDEFLLRGYWKSGWDPKTDEYRPIIEQIRPGDRIAIKKGLGQGSSDTMIRAIGVVKDVEPEQGTVYVDWLLRGMKRKVPSRGCYKTIHGPFRKGVDPDMTDWLNKVFSL